MCEEYLAATLSTWPTELISLVAQYQKTADYIVSYRTSAKSIFIHPIGIECIHNKAEEEDEEENDGAVNLHLVEEKDIQKNKKKYENDKWTRLFNFTDTNVASPLQMIPHGDALYISDQRELLSIVSLKDKSIHSHNSGKPKIAGSVMFRNSKGLMKLCYFGGDCKKAKHYLNDQNECKACTGKMMMLYDIETKTLTNLPPSNHHHNSFSTECVIYGNTAYLFTAPKNQNEQFNFSTMTWSEVPATPPEVLMLGEHVVVRGSGIFFFGCYVENESEENIYLYEVSTNSWHKMNLRMIPLKEKITNVVYEDESGLISIVSSHQGSIMIWKIHILRFYSAEIEAADKDDDDEDVESNKGDNNDGYNDKENIADNDDNDDPYQWWYGPLFIKQTMDDLVINVINI